MLVGKLHHIFEAILVVFEQDSKLVPENKVACSDGELLNIAHICVHLHSKLIHCERVVALYVEVFVIQKMITSLLLLLTKLIEGLSTVVASKYVLLLDGIVLPH